MESTAIVVACAPCFSERVSAKASARSLLPAAVGPRIFDLCSYVPAGFCVGGDVDRVAAPGLADGSCFAVFGVPYVDLLNRADLAPVSLEGVLLDGPQNLEK